VLACLLLLLAFRRGHRGTPKGTKALLQEVQYRSLQKMHGKAVMHEVLGRKMHASHRLSERISRVEKDLASLVDVHNTLQGYGFAVAARENGGGRLGQGLEA
jgi:hypothetical protein